jgi:hypothetical protein
MLDRRLDSASRLGPTGACQARPPGTSGCLRCSRVKEWRARGRRRRRRCRSAWRIERPRAEKKPCHPVPRLLSLVVVHWLKFGLVAAPRRRSRAFTREPGGSDRGGRVVNTIAAHSVSLSLSLSLSHPEQPRLPPMADPYSAWNGKHGSRASGPVQGRLGRTIPLLWLNWSRARMLKRKRRWRIRFVDSIGNGKIVASGSWAAPPVGFFIIRPIRSRNDPRHVKHSFDGQ